MATTVLTPLGKDTYSRGLGPVFFFPAGDEVGVRLGDADTLRVTIAEEEGADINSNEYSTLFVADKEPGVTKAEVELVLKQMSPTARAASLMGTKGQLGQLSELSRTFTTSAPGVYHVETYDMQDLVVSKGAAVAVEGVDYSADVRMGVLEQIGAGELTWTWDQPAIPARFVTGIASGSGIRGKLVFPGLNAKGKRSGVIVRDVLLKPTAGRDFISSEISKISLKGLASPVSGVKPGTEIGYETDLPAINEG